MADLLNKDGTGEGEREWAEIVDGKVAMAGKKPRAMAAQWPRNTADYDPRPVNPDPDQSPDGPSNPSPPVTTSAPNATSQSEQDQSTSERSGGSHQPDLRSDDSTAGQTARLTPKPLADQPILIWIMLSMDDQTADPM